MEKGKAFSGRVMSIPGVCAGCGCEIITTCAQHGGEVVTQRADGESKKDFQDRAAFEGELAEFLPPGITGSVTYEVSPKDGVSLSVDMYRVFPDGQVWPCGNFDMGEMKL
ncbi:unnamed protein product [marine sediment metagenome]|uniref:Uncharacterized protein n=1 Tax=marine sediment metagenome TaxID=412755 RepID=X1UM08_9ZZZZ